MVTKLKDNLSYVEFIRKKMKESIPEWKEHGESLYKDQINNNFQIDYIGNIQGYLDSIHKVSFVKDRGLLELRIYHKDEPIYLGFLLYNGILERIPDQDKDWKLAICKELIEYYVDFLKSYLVKN